MREYVYLAGDFDHDGDVVKQIQKWNKDPNKDLKFKDAHEITQARDESLNCSIKESLLRRMNESHTFVIVVGNNTKMVRAGSCSYCMSYYNGRCYRGNSLSDESYIEFECRKAVESGLRIIVIYNSSVIDRNKCPSIIANKGKHIPAYYYVGRECYWNYCQIRDSIMNRC